MLRSNMNRKPIFPTALCALLIAGISGCGNGSAPEKQNQVSSGSSQTSKSSKEGREIVITANDQMKFNIESFTVKPGQRVHIVLKNIGQMPKASMRHNVVILTQSTDPESFIEKAMNAAINGYIPSGSGDSIIAKTELLGGGEQDTLIFTAPTDTGDYTFLCSFPGHFQSGMKGIMRVEEFPRPQP